MKNSLILLVLLFFSQVNAQWKVSNTGLLPVKNHKNIVVHALKMCGTNIYAGTLDGLFISKDSGETWTKAKFPSKPFKEDYPEVEVTCVEAVGKNVFVATTGGMYYSNDSGVSWKFGPKGLQKSQYADVPDGVNAVAANATTIFAGCSEQADVSHHLIKNTGGIFISTDNGASWKRSSQGLEEFDVKEIVVSGKNVFLSSYGHTYMSADNGITWTKMKENLSSFASLGNQLYASHKEMFFSKDNGVTFTKANKGLPVTPVSCIAVTEELAIAGVEEAGIYLTTNKGLEWKSITGDWKNFSKYGIYGIVITATDVLIATNEGIMKRPLKELIK